jgi:heterodisulfide reductase subunit C
MAENEGMAPSEPGIDLFEKLFLKSVKKSGRVQELKVVMQYNLRTWNPFKDMGAGMKLMAKGIISPWDFLKRAKKNVVASRIFTKVRQAENGEGKK